MEVALWLPEVQRGWKQETKLFVRVPSLRLAANVHRSPMGWSSFHPPQTAYQHSHVCLKPPGEKTMRVDTGIVGKCKEENHIGGEEQCE